MFQLQSDMVTPATMQKTVSPVSPATLRYEHSRTFDFTGENSLPEVSTMSDHEIEQLLASTVSNAGSTHTDRHNRFACAVTGKIIYPTKNAGYAARDHLNSMLVSVHKDPYLCVYCKEYHLSTIKRLERYNEALGIWDNDDKRSRIPINKRPAMEKEQERKRGYFARPMNSAHYNSWGEDVSILLSRCANGKLEVQRLPLESDSKDSGQNSPSTETTRVSAYSHGSNVLSVEETTQALVFLRNSKLADNYLPILEAVYKDGTFVLPQEFVQKRGDSLATSATAILLDRHLGAVQELSDEGTLSQEELRRKLLGNYSLLELEVLVTQLRGTPSELWKKGYEPMVALFTAMRRDYLATVQQDGAFLPKHYTNDIDDMSLEEFIEFDSNWKHANPWFGMERVVQAIALGSGIPSTMLP